tara:strand:+ start:5822 stop:6076 length:255 start_codon:yes stop_codon:yes gene_type:complete
MNNLNIDRMLLDNQPLTGGRRSSKRRSSKRKARKVRRAKKGGSLLADASVPAGLFLLHRYLKNRNSRKANKKASKKSRRTRRRR